MKVGFTGTQKGITSDQRERLLYVFGILSYSSLGVDPILEFHYGDGIGADAQAAKLASSFGFKLVVHPPMDERKRAFVPADKELEARSFLERNHRIVRLTEFLIATPDSFEEKQRSGVWATVRYARRNESKILLIFPDGSMRTEGGQ